MNSMSSANKPPPQVSVLVSNSLIFKFSMSCPLKQFFFCYKIMFKILKFMVINFFDLQSSYVFHLTIFLNKKNVVGISFFRLWIVFFHACILWFNFLDFLMRFHLSQFFFPCFTFPFISLLPRGPSGLVSSCKCLHRLQCFPMFLKNQRLPPSHWGVTETRTGGWSSTSQTATSWRWSRSTWSAARGFFF